MMRAELAADEIKGLVLDGQVTRSAGFDKRIGRVCIGRGVDSGSVDVLFAQFADPAAGSASHIEDAAWTERVDLLMKHRFVECLRTHTRPLEPD